MASAMHLPLLLLCLLVGHTHGSRPVMLRSIHDSGASSSASACSSIPKGFSSGNKLPVVHRLSRCSPLGRARKRKQGGKPSLGEILHRDGLRLRYLSDIHRSDAAPGPSLSSAPAAAPGPSQSTPASAIVSFPATQNIIRSLPGVFDYTVLVGYGTPAQPLPLYFDASGMSNIRCKPCFGAGSDPCGGGYAFDPSLSSSFRTVPCDAPECGAATSSCSSPGEPCSFTFQNATYVYGNGTVVTDTLTLSPSAAVPDLAVGCMQVDHLYSGGDGVAAGNIDLSKSRDSLVSRLLPTLPPNTAAFSYCLPADTDAHGFLAVAPALSDYSGINGVQYMQLVNNSRGPSFYFVDLFAISVNGKYLPFTAAAPEFAGNGTMIDAQSWFTYLNPAIYAVLRDEFRQSMAKYPPAPAFDELDTCYNFTGYSYIQLPEIALRFGNGVIMDLDDRQFMYFFREHLNDDFPFGCLAFAPAQDVTFPWNVLGTQLQRTKEVVYDVRGGRIGFVPSRCGLR
ncbi:hypothetical protein EJB05_45117, partial [Eragrostis curvula]